MNILSSAPSAACAAATAGKIACLPPHLQEELNRRLAARIPGSQLLPWLNSLQEVQAILRDSFHSRPINHQNLTNWRRGRFLQWHTRQSLLQNFRELNDDAAAIEESLGSLTDHAARLLAFHFSQILCPRDLIHGRPTRSAPDPQPPGSNVSSSFSDANIKLLCAITRAISSLRRGDHAATRLKLQQQKQTSKPEPSSDSALLSSPLESRLQAERSGATQANNLTISLSQSSTPASTPLSIGHSLLSIPARPPLPTARPSPTPSTLSTLSTRAPILNHPSSVINAPTPLGNSRLFNPFQALKPAVHPGETSSPQYPIVLPSRQNIPRTDLLLLSGPPERLWLRLLRSRPSVVNLEPPAPAPINATPHPAKPDPKELVYPTEQAVA